MIIWQAKLKKIQKQNKQKKKKNVLEYKDNSEEYNKSDVEESISVKESEEMQELIDIFDDEEDIITQNEIFDMSNDDFEDFNDVDIL